jgi:hypothetical protein
MQIFPVEMAHPVELRFAHIAMVEAGDSAIVEASYDSGATWTRVRSYNYKSDPAWIDRTVDPGDWRQEVVTLTHPHPAPGAFGLVRFRLKSTPAAQLDGWYIDDIAFGGIASAPRDADAPGFEIASYPNPTRSVAFIEYTLPRTSSVRLGIVDALGNAVRTLVDGVQEGGRYVATFDGTGLPSGVYFYDMVANGALHRGRIVISK